MGVKGRPNNRTDAFAEQIRRRAEDGADLDQLATIFGFTRWEIRSCATRNGFKVYDPQGYRRRRGTPDPTPILGPDQISHLRFLLKVQRASRPLMAWCPGCGEIVPLDDRGRVGAHVHRRPGEATCYAEPCFGIGRNPVKK